MTLSGNADQINSSAFKSRELVLASVAAFVKTPALPPNLIIQWIEVG